MVPVHSACGPGKQFGHAVHYQATIEQQSAQVHKGYQHINTDPGQIPTFAS